MSKLNLSRMHKITFILALTLATFVSAQNSPRTDLSPENLVQQQVEGYNAGDIDAFMAPYSDSMEIYNFPNQFQEKGKIEIAKRYEEMFRNIPDLHCEIINRTIHGNTVIDKERITGLPNGKIMEALAIYVIENSKIQRVYFGEPIMIDLGKK